MKTAVLVPCYRRPEYTKMCIEALEKAQAYPEATFFLVDDGSNDGTREILEAANLPKVVISNEHTIGLRSVITDFFRRTKDFDVIVKIDNDCEVPADWLNKLVHFVANDIVQIVSPNVVPSDAAHKLGTDMGIENILVSTHVGGLWCMKRSLLEGIEFEEIQTDGITGAFPLLRQIIIEKEPLIGWATNVTVEDIGHYSGAHPKHIKSQEHLDYSHEVGRAVAWA